MAKTTLEVIQIAIKVIEEMEQIIKDVQDPTPCSLDHHGHCQEHGWTGESSCPQERIRKLLDN